MHVITLFPFLPLDLSAVLHYRQCHPLATKTTRDEETRRQWPSPIHLFFHSTQFPWTPFSGRQLNSLPYESDIKRQRAASARQRHSVSRVIVRPTYRPRRDDQHISRLNLCVLIIIIISSSSAMLSRREVTLNRATVAGPFHPARRASFGTVLLLLWRD